MQMPELGVDEGTMEFGVDDDDEDTRWAWAGLARGAGTGTGAVDGTGGHDDAAPSCSCIRYTTGERDGLLSRERSCLSSTAPFTSFTTTTGMSVSGVRGESAGLGLGLTRQPLLLPVVTLAAPPSA